MNTKELLLALALIGLIFSSCANEKRTDQTSHIKETTRIVSLNGTLSEILCAFDLGQNIVGVDVTSTFPDYLRQLPKVGHNRNISSEGIISLNPDLVIGFENELKPEAKEQLASAGIKLMFFEREYSVAGSEKLFTSLADTLQVLDKKDSIIHQIHLSLSQIVPFEEKPRVLFIYARGAGNLMVSGQNTSVSEMISLAGGVNAVQGFEDYKPLTSEALVAANPDVILLFSSGLESLEQEKGLEAVPGIALTNAGKNSAFIAMDGQYLAGFGPRLGEAALELNQKLHLLASSSALTKR